MIGGSVYLMIALVVAMFATILLGMGMPTLPAYVNVILIIGPLLVALGTSLFTAHMFIFYFAVASAITPPVAIAAFAASTISKAEPPVDRIRGCAGRHRHVHDPLRFSPSIRNFC